MGILSWRSMDITKFSAPPERQNYASDPENFSRCKNVLQVPYYRAKFGGAQISPADRAAKNDEFFVYLSVCSPRFWTSEIVCPISPWRRWSALTILMPLDRGRFVVVHPCSTFSDYCQLATPLNAENGKNWGFFANKGRQNKPIETKFGT